MFDFVSEIKFAEEEIKNIDIDRYINDINSKIEKTDWINHIKLAVAYMKKEYLDEGLFYLQNALTIIKNINPDASFDNVYFSEEYKVIDHGDGKFSIEKIGCCTECCDGCENGSTIFLGIIGISAVYAVFQYSITSCGDICGIQALSEFECIEDFVEPYCMERCCCGDDSCCIQCGEWCCDTVKCALGCRN